MKSIRLIIPIFLFSFLFSCSKDDEPTIEEIEEVEEEEGRNLEVEEFIFFGMNDIYLYKADIPELADDYFTTMPELHKYFNTYDTPEDLFYNGFRSSQDRFSVLVDDYVILENSSAGIETTNGVNVAFGRITGTNDVFGIVLYVLPNTSAAEEGVKRGDVFTEIDGQQMNDTNYLDLFYANSYTIDINRIEGEYITPSGTTATLSRQQYTTNPILISKTLEADGKKVGYLMYNSFTANFDDELNAAFADFQAQGITDLVLDLRYNGGGSVESAVDLSSMITGQFDGQVFLKQQWNAEYQAAYEAQNPEWLINRFNKNITIDRNTPQEREELINSLNLNKVYVLTSSSSASASELVINSLSPYIDVVQIGETTTGKFQASTRLYDSPGMVNKENVNENHTYAIQPLIFKSANRDGLSDFVEGLDPDIEILEDLGNMGELGDTSEPLLQAALNAILNKGQDQAQAVKARENSKRFKIIGESGMNSPTYQRMYVDEIPMGIIRD